MPDADPFLPTSPVKPDAEEDTKRFLHDPVVEQTSEERHGDRAEYRRQKYRNDDGHEEMHDGEGYRDEPAPFAAATLNATAYLEENRERYCEKGGDDGSRDTGSDTILDVVEVRAA